LPLASADAQRRLRSALTAEGGKENMIATPQDAAHG
jgi:hypothetical protein